MEFVFFKYSFIYLISKLASGCAQQVQENLDENFIITKTYMYGNYHELKYNKEKKITKLDEHTVNK